MIGAGARVQLFYVDRRRVDQRWAIGPDAGSVRAMLDRRVLPDGMPVLLDEWMRPVVPVCAWFRSLAYANRQPETMRAYAYVVRRLVAFLAERGGDLLSVTEADLVAYRAARTQLQDSPVGDAAWAREAVVVNLLYTWLVEQGYLKRRPFRMRSARNVLGSGVRREMQVRHLTVEQYLFFRDVGLGGQLPGARVDLGFRGWAPHRSRAGLELALLTGMRKQEWSTLLLPELGHGTRRPGDAVDVVVQACAKYGRRRVVYVPPAASEMVDTYLLLERSEIVQASARSLARRHRELFVVDDIDSERGKLRGVLEGRRRVFTISAMDPELRAVTVRETGNGLEPLAVFVGYGGRMLGPSSWDRLRQDAWRRMRAHAEAGQAPRMPRQQWRFHDARHTFALQLLKYLMRLATERETSGRGGRPSLVTLAEHVAFNPLLIVQRRLGHASPANTYVYLRYLEDPMNYIDEAFRAWTEHDGATYAQIAQHAMSAAPAEHAPTR